mmetsp:Transcript_1058/g.2978  ORF Transcript_1058/g.2978 Transcript_1058/m.2978 type:complete len:255 (-) Transcript_1058:56-820(-)
MQRPDRPGGLLHLPARHEVLVLHCRHGAGVQEGHERGRERHRVDLLLAARPREPSALLQQGGRQAERGALRRRRRGGARDAGELEVARPRLPRADVAVPTRRSRQPPEGQAEATDAILRPNRYHPHQHRANRLRNVLGVPVPPEVWGDQQGGSGGCAARLRVEGNRGGGRGTHPRRPRGPSVTRAAAVVWRPGTAAGGPRTACVSGGLPLAAGWFSSRRGSCGAATPRPASSTIIGGSCTGLRSEPLPAAPTRC